MKKRFAEAEIKKFWENHNRFLKTGLVTEAANPLTYNLSHLCQTDLAQAFNIFKQVEINSIQELKKYTAQITNLQHDIQTCLTNSGRIFLIGCGASGRLAMLLKRLYANYHPNKSSQIICVSSAGDISLIRSVEQFEDQAEFGVKQLIQQGFASQDLLIGLTASGESPFILAAVEYAANFSQRQPYLVFNNPIASIIERNPNHLAITNPTVKLLELDVASMALTGSTRLQATTAMQTAVGLSLCFANSNIEHQINTLAKLISQLDLPGLIPITKLEAKSFNNNEYVLYQTNNSLLGLSLLADITERSPTFNLIPFENNTVRTNKYSPFYLSLTTANEVNQAWELLLGSKPTCLNWPEFPQTSSKYINGFDLSKHSARAIGQYLPNIQNNSQWLIDNHGLAINFKGAKFNFNLPEDFLQQTLIYKLCLNSHSTLMMGILGYFAGNLMLSLKPSNFKLIDRAIRYSQFILKQQYKIDIEYNHLAEIVFSEMENLEPNQSIVKNVVNKVTHNFIK